MEVKDIEKDLSTYFISYIILPKYRCCSTFSIWFSKYLSSLCPFCLDCTSAKDYLKFNSREEQYQFATYRAVKGEVELYTAAPCLGYIPKFSAYTKHHTFLKKILTFKYSYKYKSRYELETKSANSFVHGHVVWHKQKIC